MTFQDLAKKLGTCYGNVHALIDTLREGFAAVEVEAGGKIEYTKTEREIGTWINGKKLYERTYDIGALTTGTEKQYAIEAITYYEDIWIENVYVDATAVGGQRHYSVPGNYTEPSYEIYANIRHDFGNTKALINVKPVSYWSAIHCYVTIRYTKP